MKAIYEPEGRLTSELSSGRIHVSRERGLDPKYDILSRRPARAMLPRQERVYRVGRFCVWGPTMLTLKEIRDMPKQRTSHGYSTIRIPDHPHGYGCGYVYEHRAIVECLLGRYLHTKEYVHHKNRGKMDNRPQNLVLVDGIAGHKLQHRTGKSLLRRPGEPNPVIECACGCHRAFLKYDDWGRPRRLGAGCARRCLLPADIEAIRQEYRSENVSTRALAKRHKVGKTLIAKLVRGSQNARYISA